MEAEDIMQRCVSLYVLRENRKQSHGNDEQYLSELGERERREYRAKKDQERNASYDSGTNDFLWKSSEAAN